jgi:hypothetical protein
MVSPKGKVIRNEKNWSYTRISIPRNTGNATLLLPQAKNVSYRVGRRYRLTALMIWMSKSFTGRGQDYASA